MGGPLDGIRVLDFSRVLAGPHCARALADLGADVIKVEPPEGDLTRFFIPRSGNMSVYFAQQNAGKRNISLDLRQPAAAELLLAMAPHTDVVLENFRPGVMARMGLGPDVWEARNPRIIYAAVSGYGQDGPWKDRRAYARVVHAETGWMTTDAMTKGRAPEHDTYSHADTYSALECLAAINAALFQRERTGRGQRIDVAMAQVLLTVNEHAAIDISGLPLEGGSGMPFGGRAKNPVFRMADGHWVTMPSDPCQADPFELYVEATGLQGLRADPRFGDVASRKAHREELLAEFQRWIEAQPSAQAIEDAFGKVRIPVGVLRTIGEIADSDWARERGVLAEVDDGDGGTLRVPDAPWRFSAADAGVRGAPAFRGQHNREVLRELLGTDDATLDALERDGVLSSRGPR